MTNDDSLKSSLFGLGPDDSFNIIRRLTWDADDGDTSNECHCDVSFGGGESAYGNCRKCFVDAILLCKFGVGFGWVEFDWFGRKVKVLADLRSTRNIV